MDAEVGTRAVSEDNATVIVELDKMRISDNSSPHQWVSPIVILHYGFYLNSILAITVILRIFHQFDRIPDTNHCLTRTTD